MQFTVESRSWPMREPFAISRSVEYAAETIVVVAEGEGDHRGRGEASGVDYHGETQASMIAQIESIRRDLESGASRDDLLGLLPPGGARSALDIALWDLEAKRTGRSVFDLVGLGVPRSLETAFTIGIRDIDAYESAARAHADHALLKVKVASDQPLAAIEAVHRGAPNARLIVDPNMAWSVELLKELAPRLAALGVALLEQPIKIGDEELLDGYTCPIPLCADELVQDVNDLPKARGRFSVINIKLDKAGGLTTALNLQNAALDMGFQTMIGCMAGSSLAMAPGIVIGQRCTFVDLDGPLLLSNDWPNGLRYQSGMVEPPSRNFWG
jgi:L-alanine-DL-glutamate epimerase-like enolase superfamily enzyme